MTSPSPDALITLSAPDRPLDRALLQAPGGFAWWYMDLLDGHGAGVVLIWSWGLPFLPGLASAARAGRPVVPMMRPSLNVAIYEDWRLESYLLQEYAPAEATWVDGERRWRFGQSELEVTRTDELVELRAQLDCALPGTRDRLTGTVTLEGVARRAAPDEAGAPDPHHDWTPRMGPATGRAQLAVGGRARHDITGRGYHDRNGGTAPLHELGFDRWIWGRLPFEDRERIYYILWPSGGGDPACVGLEIGADGQTTRHDEVDVRLTGPQTTLAGMRTHERIEVFVAGQPWLDVTPRARLDDGPFYLRYFVEARCGDEQTVGFGEACQPERVDLARHRPLVRMRVHEDREGGANSMWLPLFTGPRRGRLRRLLRNNLPL